MMEALAERVNGRTRQGYRDGVGGKRTRAYSAVLPDALEYPLQPVAFVAATDQEVMGVMGVKEKDEVKDEMMDEPLAKRGRPSY